MTIGERIKQRRKELGLSVDELAELLHKNRATIYRYESNEIEKLPTTVLEPLAKALGVTPAYLMGWEIELRATDESEVDLHSESDDVIFTGYPGTGKTTIANLIDRLNKEPENKESILAELESAYKNSASAILALAIPEDTENTVRSKTAESRRKKIQEKYFGVDPDNKETKINAKSPAPAMVINFDELGDIVIEGAELLDYYKMLNDNGKEEAVKRVKELTQLPEYTADIPVYTKNKE